MIGGRGIIAILDRHAEVPLAKVSGRIAVFLEYFGDRRFTFQKVHSVKALVEDGVDSGADMVAASEETGARRGTGRGSRVKVGETHATSSQLVENWSLDGTVVAADVAVPQIVDIKCDDIRQFVIGKTETSQQQRE